MHFFYEIEGDLVPGVADREDFLVLSLLFFAMRKGIDLHIDGRVSRELLINLEEFQRAWVMWAPTTYRAVRITCREEIPEAAAAAARVAVAAFSGGVDATFSLTRHALASQARDRCAIATAVFVHGFDIKLDQPAAFATALANAREMTTAMHVPLTTVRTDWRSIGGIWEFEFCAGIAAVLTLFQGPANIGLIGSDEDYMHFVPYSNPITNHFMSSGTFRIFTEGGSFSRSEKVAELARVPELAERLRVCWQGPATGRNCGQCEKCIRTKLNFLASGNAIPRALGRVPSVLDILRLKAMKPIQVGYLEEIHTHARRHGSMPRSMLRALRIAIAKNRALNRRPYLRSALRLSTAPVRATLSWGTRLLGAGR